MSASQKHAEPTHRDHVHDHHPHTHGLGQHRHAHGPRSEAQLAGPKQSSLIVPRLSLIALSGLQRLVFVLPAIAILWLLALWAITNG